MLFNEKEILAKAHQVSPHTMKAYTDRATLLIERFYRESGLKWNEHPEQFLLWLKLLAIKTKKSSFKQYKAALMYYMNQHGSVEILSEIRKLQGSYDGNGRTSAQKQKKVVPEDLLELIEGIEGSRSEYASFLLCQLYANLYLGLRPCEWEHAKLNYEEKKLLVKNAKFTQGRGRLGERELDLSAFSETCLNIIGVAFQLLDELRQNGKDFSTIYSACRQLLWKLQEGKPSKISLYSTRHQSVANLKSIGLSREEIAIIFGHSSLKTASTHYAKKSSGYGEKSYLIIGTDVAGTRLKPNGKA